MKNRKITVTFDPAHRINTISKRKDKQEALIELLNQVALDDLALVEQTLENIQKSIKAEYGEMADISLTYEGVRFLTEGLEAFAWNDCDANLRGLVIAWEIYNNGYEIKNHSKEESCNDEWQSNSIADFIQTELAKIGYSYCEPVGGDRPCGWCVMPFGC